MFSRQYVTGTTHHPIGGQRCATHPAAPATAPLIARIGAVASPAVFSSTVLLEGLQPGYDRIRDTVSALVWGPGGWAQTAAFFLFGLLLAVLALQLREIWNRGKALNVGTTLLMVIGVAFLVMGIFPTGLPGDEPSAAATIHEVAACAVSALFPVMCFSIAAAMKSDPRRRNLRIYMTATGTLGVLLTAAGAIAMVTEAVWLGAAERLMLGNGLVWVEIAALQCLSDRGRTAGGRPAVRP